MAVTTPAPIDYLVIVTVTGEQVVELTQQLVQAHFYFTHIESIGGLVPKAAANLLIGVTREQRESLMELLEKYCQRRRTYVPARMETVSIQSQPVMIEAEIGGADIYTFEIERFEQF